MKKYFKNQDLFPFLLLFICLLVFGILIPLLGFYWDDFPYLWFRHTTGVSGVMKAIALDRPLLALFYTLPMSIFGDTPWVWQIAAIISRWVFTLSVYAFLKNLWPEQKSEIKLITLLFLVFPGFKQQWISVIYTHVFFVFALYFYSLALFIKSIQSRNEISFNLIASITLSLLCMTAVEYVVGLELLRPLIIFKLLAKDMKKREMKEKIIQTIKLWLPYLIPFMLFVLYRVFIASSVLYKVQQFSSFTSNPLNTLLDLVSQQFKNIYTSTLLVWAQVFDPLVSFDRSSIFSILSIGFLLLILVITFFFTFRYSHVHENSKQWILELSIGASFSLLFAGLPFWAANLNPTVDFPGDRMLLPFMLGSTLLLFAIIYIFKKRKIFFYGLFSLIFALSAAFQIYQANLFRNDWDDFCQFMQQISWRIPSLKEGTLLVTDQLPLEYYSDNSLTAVVNWIYADPPVKNDDTLPYMVNYTESRLGGSLSSLDPGTKIMHNYRTFVFTGSTDEMIIFYHQPPGCVHIVDPDLDGSNPLLPAFLREYAAYSRIDLILKEENQNELFFLSDSPAESWCYYYQKASLAAQLGEWEQVTHLGNTAFSLNDYPNDASERFPFIEGYARSGDWNRALLLSKATVQISDLYQPMICKLWQNLKAETEESQEKNSALSQIIQEIKCEII